MDCGHARRALEAAFDGVDVGARLAEAEAHADVCRPCGSYRRELRAYAAIVEDLRHDPAPVEVPEGLEDRLLSAVERAKPRPVPSVLRLALLAGAGVLLVAALQAQAARGREDAARTQARRDQAEAIARQIERDRAASLADPMAGTPTVAFAQYATARATNARYGGR